MRDIGARCWKDSGARMKAVIMTKLGDLCKKINTVWVVVPRRK